VRSPRAVRLAIAAAALASATAFAPASASPATRAPSSTRATLATFAGGWIGHTRDLTIGHFGHSRADIGDGCCDPIITFRFNLSDVRGTTKNASAKAKVTVVHVHRKSAFPAGSPPPHKGEVRRIHLKNGVITDPFTGNIFCDAKAEKAGTCGA
jgi:hypothetical protein